MGVFILLILGLALILIGANYLVNGASDIAKRLGVSDFIIGMTIIGFGTSAPEMVVSILSAIDGNANIAVGNILGSNIFNTLVILGVTALIAPVPLTSDNMKKDIPFGLLAAGALVVAGSDMILDNSISNSISRTDGLLFLLLFCVFMAYTVYSSLGNKDSAGNIGNKNRAATDGSGEKESAQAEKRRPVIISVIMTLGGLGALIYGGDLFVDSATEIAVILGVSDAVIAVTILAGGTSLPELASCAVAAYKKKTDLALGNVIGSNVFNIFLVLGGSAVIHPLGLEKITITDLSILFISAFLLFLAAFTFKKRAVDRVEGALFLLLYVAYIILVIKSPL